MKYTLEELQKIMDDNGGSLYLSGKKITYRPDNLTVGGWLDLSGTKITYLPDNLNVGGWLDLSGTKITYLPDNLTVGGSIDLSGTKITYLPENLTVGGALFLRGTPITSMPDNLTVGGLLDLRGTKITSLPNNLTVGGSLYLSGTPITSLPDNLAVGGWLDISGTQITSLPENIAVGRCLFNGGTPIESKKKENKKVKRMKNGDYVEGRYLYCDDTLIHVKRKRKIGEYTYYVGKIKGMNVIYDGENYAHCKDFRDGVNDLEFKKSEDRGADQYRDYTMDTVVSFEDAKTMYRIITGSCKAGTEQFVNGLRSVKEQYTVREIIEITKNAYRGEVFKAFFTK